MIQTGADLGVVRLVTRREKRQTKKNLEIMSNAQTFLQFQLRNQNSITVQHPNVDQFCTLIYIIRLYNRTCEV